MTATRETGWLRLVAALSVVLVALTAAACGDDDDDATATADESGSGDGDMTLEISSPGDGEDVGESFDLQFDSGVELGPTDTGLHHVHLYPDTDGDEYEVVESDSSTVDEPEPRSAGADEVNSAARA